MTRRVTTAREQHEMLSPWREAGHYSEPGDPVHSIPTGELRHYRLFNPAIHTPEDMHDSLYRSVYGEDGDPPA